MVFFILKNKKNSKYFKKKVIDWTFVYLVLSFITIESKLKHLEDFANNVGILVAYQKVVRKFTALENFGALIASNWENL